MWKLALLALLLGVNARALTPGDSFYPLRPPDPAAVDLATLGYPIHGDGKGDDTDALQQAINRVQETTVRGIVLIPEGRYRVTRTVHVWSGIRLIGYGARRPVIVLAEETPGYQDGEGKYLLHFVSSRPRPGEPIRDANPGTFYSGLSNLNLEIGAGNPAAVGVRSHFAQHGFIAHVDFHIGSGRAGIEAVGNEIEDCRFFGGDYGILTRKPSPSWPFVALDTVFSGQRVAAIRTEEAGLTIVRAEFRDVPTVVSVNPERSEELFIEDARFVRVAGPALVISEEANARTQVNLLNVACEDVPVLAQWRESGRAQAGLGRRFVVRRFSHGLHVPGPEAHAGIETRLEAQPVVDLPEPVPSDVPALPAMTDWRSVADFGARGDGVTDDTEALRAAVAAHPALFLPAGRYRVTDTIELRPESVLIALHPLSTQWVVDDAAPAFLGAGAREGASRASSGVAFETPRSQGTGGPKALLETPAGGRNIITGLGLATGNNQRAVAVKWRAGADSLLNDVRFHGGHGSYRPDGSAPPLYNNNRTGEADPTRRWDSQYWSLWVTEGGGGTFKNLWTPNPLAAAGLYVSDTETSGRVYALSSEHHVRHEVVLRRVANWRFYALQFEEERGEGPAALPLLIDQCRDLTFANLYLYRVMTTYSPFPHGVLVQDSPGVRFRGVHAYSPSKFTFDVTIEDRGSGQRVLARELAWYDVPAAAAPDRNRAVAPTAAAVAARPVERLAGGFNSIDGLAVDRAGNVCFVDARWQRIYRWEHATGTLRRLREHPLEPVALAFDRAGWLLVVTRLGTVFTFDPDAWDEAVHVLEPEPARSRPEAVPVLPASRWRDSHDFLPVNTTAAPQHVVSRDGSTFIPVTDDFTGAGYRHSFFSTIDLIRAYGLVRAEPGKPVYVADEFGQKTWRFPSAPDGTLTEPRLLAEEGEGAVAVDPRGNVYVPAGLIFVYAPDGRLMDRLEVPERPTALAFGGADGRTLFIAARSSLYSWRIP